MRKYGGQESANLSQFGSDRGDRGSFLYQFCCRLNFTYFRFRPSNAKCISDVLPRNATLRSMFFFLLYNAHCLLTHRVSLRS
jgi:hypothetical protein